MSVHETRQGKWEVRWREGKRNRSRTFDAKSDADEFDEKVRRKRQLGEPIITRRDVPHLDDFSHECVQRWELFEDLTESTLLGVANLLDNYILPYLGHLSLLDLRAERLEAWSEQVLTDRGKPYMVQRAMALLSRILDRAVILGYIPGHALPALERPKHRRRRGKAATVEQVEAMRAWFMERDRFGDATLISVMAEGLRPAEALAVTWPGFDGRRLHVATHLRDGEVVAGTKRGRRAEEGPPRWVELAGPHAADLAEWRLAMGRPHGLIFPRASDGLGWRKHDWDNWRKRSFQPAAGAAGLLEWDTTNKRWVGDFTPYSLRHTAASVMIAAGRPITEVAAHLGHGVDVCMRTYSHLIEEMKGQPIRPVDQLIREARGQAAQKAEGAHG